MAEEPLSSKQLLLVVTILLVVIVSTAFIWQGMVNRNQSEYHEFRYSIAISTQSVLENVTLLLPVPFVHNNSLLGEALIKGEGYDIPPDWRLSLEYVNDTPMLKIFTAKIVPEYHGYPIPIEPGRTPNRTPPPTITAYSSETPILIPLEFGISQRVPRLIDTQNPFNREPLLSYPELLESIPCQSPSLPGRCYQYMAPIYVQYLSGEVGNLTIFISGGGMNQWGEWSWSGNSYDETIDVTLENNQQRWIQGKSYLSTGNGRY
ncbi:MAG: hypothetical protein MUO95_07495 [Methanoregula sp.]|jgi:hypothetical protein|nr:hypothetical protein [Methanoregula sp.]